MRGINLLKSTTLQEKNEPPLPIEVLIALVRQTRCLKWRCSSIPKSSGFHFFFAACFVVDVGRGTFHPVALSNFSEKKIGGKAYSTLSDGPQKKTAYTYRTTSTTISITILLLVLAYYYKVVLRRKSFGGRVTKEADDFTFCTPPREFARASQR